MKKNFLTQVHVFVLYISSLCFSIKLTGKDFNLINKINTFNIYTNKVKCTFYMSHGIIDVLYQHAHRVVFKNADTGQIIYYWLSFFIWPWSPKFSLLKAWQSLSLDQIHVLKTPQHSLVNSSFLDDVQSL